MDKAKVDAVHAALMAAVKSIEVAQGVKLQGGRMTYGRDGSFTFKISGGVVGADGKAVTREREAFIQLAQMYGFKPTDLGAKFRSNGRTFAIDGLRTRARTKPVLATCEQDGKQYIFPTEAVQRALLAGAVTP